MPPARIKLIPSDIDHALVITRIDPDNNLIYYNDPGDQWTGASRAGSLSVFEQSWGFSDHAMISTNPDRVAGGLQVTLPTWPADTPRDGLVDSPPSVPATSAPPLPATPTPPKLRPVS